MKKNEASVFIFAAAIIVGILITSTFSFDRKPTRIILDSKQYQDKYNYRNTLVSQVDALRNKYLDLLSKTNKFRSNQSAAIMEKEIQDELNNAKVLTGISDVEGQGIVITVEDGTDKLNGVEIKNQDDKSKILHNEDMLNMLNELKIAGAEAISINGQRLLSSSEVECEGPFLGINGVQVPSPYNIYVIGNKEKLYDYVNGDSSYFSLLLNVRGISITVNKQDDVKIAGYTGKVPHSNLRVKN